MRVSRSSLAWGLTLILLGVFLFAQQQGMIRVPVPAWSLLFGAAGLLFLLGALTDLSKWGLLFPGFILLGIGVVIFLSESTSASGNVIGSVFLASVALPFWVVALVRRANWWALIPAGVITTVGMMPLLAETQVRDEVVAGILFLGLGATFGLVRLATIGQGGMSWAWYPAVILGGIGLTLMVSNNPQAWPLVLIGAGVLLLVRSFLPRRRTDRPEAKG
ncbi:MAG TPA: hypothetical protein VJ793_03885 [Anaerolineae bacterium]|nr:hypothetical protein [Anaerolineae bacterium]